MALSRRDFIKLAGGVAGGVVGGVVGGLAFTSCLQNSVDPKNEGSSGEILINVPDKRVLDSKEAEKYVGFYAGGSIPLNSFTTETGEIYSREFDNNGKETGNWIKMDPFYLLSFPGDYNQPGENWEKLQISENVKSEGGELAYFWLENNLSLSDKTSEEELWSIVKDFKLSENPQVGPIIDLARKYKTRLMPDIKYSIITKVPVGVIESDNGYVLKYEWKFDPNKLKVLLEQYPDVVVGFTLDEPASLNTLEGADIDFQTILRQYADYTKAPIYTIRFGSIDPRFLKLINGAIEENGDISFEQFKSMDYESLTIGQKYLYWYKAKNHETDALIQLLRSKNVATVDGSFHYPFVFEDSNLELGLDEIVKQFILELEKEHIRTGKGKLYFPTWITLAAHDTDETSESFEAMRDIGDSLPEFIASDSDGFEKLLKLQFVLSMIYNPNTSRFGFWNYPLDRNPDTPIPFSRSMKGIQHLVDQLTPVFGAISGKKVAYSTENKNDDVQYSVKTSRIGEGSVGFAHISQETKSVSIFYLDPFTVYIDLFSGKRFKTNFLGQLDINANRGEMLKKHTVFCLCPIKS